MTHSVCPGEFPTAPRPGKRPGHAPTAQEASPHTQHPGLEVRPQVSGQTQGPPSALDPSESLWSSGCLVQLARHPLGCPHPTCRCLGSSPSCLRGRGHGARTSSCRGLEEVQTCSTSTQTPPRQGYWQGSRSFKSMLHAWLPWSGEGPILSLQGVCHLCWPLIHRCDGVWPSQGFTGRSRLCPCNPQPALHCLCCPHCLV